MKCWISNEHFTIEMTDICTSTYSERLQYTMKYEGRCHDNVNCLLEINTYGNNEVIIRYLSV